MSNGADVLQSVSELLKKASDTMEYMSKLENKVVNLECKVNQLEQDRDNMKNELSLLETNLRDKVTAGTVAMIQAIPDALSSIEADLDFWLNFSVNMLINKEWRTIPKTRSIFAQKFTESMSSELYNSSNDSCTEKYGLSGEVDRINTDINTYNIAFPDNIRDFYNENAIQYR